ncbi:MAG: GGDEF domain-containing protein [Lachnospiraceae bacterium]|nr:GGDEF domain-containing protein [Lachnospiraceae bacterium]
MKLWKKIWTIINQESSFDNESKRTAVVLRCVYLVMIVYHFIFFCLMGFRGLLREGGFHVSWLAVISVIATLILFQLSFRQKISTNLKLFIAAAILWLGGFVFLFGWSCGAQQIMFVMVVLVYFSFYDAIAQKAVFTVVLFLIRFAMFSYTQNFEPYTVLPDTLELVLQVWSSLSFFTLMGIICGFYSSNIETADKQLVLYNRRLKEEARTDPLTGLWNRRAMRDFLSLNMQNYPQMPFSIAMGDIDFFKRVNDTYGHDCGDAVLKWLSSHLTQMIEGKGQICRYGGEEFLLYFPDMNGDEADVTLNELLLLLARTPFEWNDNQLQISMTFGVEEYDFHSNLEEMIKKADEKLYAGKGQGRNQVVF